MPKRPRSVGLGIGRLPPTQHLYLVFDDWYCGYSIRKLDLHFAMAGSNVSGLGAIDTDTELPPPPILCPLQAPRGLPRHFAAAFDTKILAIHPRVTTYAPRMIWPRPIACDSFVPVLDVHDQGLVFCPRPKVADCVEAPLCIPVGDSFLALASDSFQLLPPPPLAEPCGDYCPWSWRALPKPPFDSSFCLVQCLATQGSSLSENRRRYVLRLSVFSLKYDDKDGDLTTDDSCHVRTFAMPEGVSEATMKHPVAFWM